MRTLFEMKLKFAGAQRFAANIPVVTPNFYTNQAVSEYLYGDITRSRGFAQTLMYSGEFIQHLSEMKKLADTSTA